VHSTGFCFGAGCCLAREQTEGRKDLQLHNHLNSSGSTSMSSESSTRWQQQLHSWDSVVNKFGIDESRYEEFSYLCFTELEDQFVKNYVDFQLGKCEPIIKGRIAKHALFSERIRHTRLVI